MSKPDPLVVIDAVGMTPRLLEHAPRLQGLVERGWMRPTREVWPSVTSVAQASILTGRLPRDHGIVANGWLFRDTREVRFWQQSNALLNVEPIYAVARRRLAERGASFTAAKLFWWYNQGADVDFSVTPKPHYGADGSKVFDIIGFPDNLPKQLEQEHGRFPFHTFWGPQAGAGCTEWIAKAAASVIRDHAPNLTLVYLPHLDYDPQRFGPSGCDMAKLVGELDEACAPLIDAADKVGARLWVVGEYGHRDVHQPILINRALRQAGLLRVRSGPFGEMLDTFGSQAFAVCDHQLAHVYVLKSRDLAAVRDCLAALEGVDRVLMGEELAELGLDHPRSGELVALAKRQAWFAYPYWLEDRHAPDFARTVDIHRKPGFDPCELFLDPSLPLPTLRIARRLAAKKLGFRTLFDVIPLDPSLVRGSHGIPETDPERMPVLIADGPPPSERGPIPITEIYTLLMNALCP